MQHLVGFNEYINMQGARREVEGGEVGGGGGGEVRHQGHGNVS